MVNLKQHPRYANIFVTPDGEIYERRTASPSDGGYYTVKIYANGSKKPLTVRRHTLVAETYHGLCPDGTLVRHRNGVAGDDRADNLLWGTQKENGEDTIEHGKTTAGEKNTQAKLNEKKVLEIRRRLAFGESGTALAEEFHVSQPTICDIGARRTWKHL